MAIERARNRWGRQPGNSRITISPAVIAALTILAGVFVDALFRCLHRTSRLGRETRQLTALSRTDPLTGLPNRRHVEDHLTAAVSAARRHHQPLSVLFIDIDSFKRVNDQFGYEAGDEVLQAIGERVRLAIRAEDLVGRWGGEEFVAVLPTTDLAGAVVVAERVRAAVACRPIRIDDGHTHVTVSVGCGSGGGEAAEVIRQASHALREAKRAGKNRVVAGHPQGE